MAPKKVMIVDDSETLRAILIFVLEEAGFEVLEGIDGIDAIKYLDGRHIDLIITDLNMPRMDGIRLIKHVRSIETYSQTPILFLTTDTQQSKKDEARNAGATGWIVKPFDQSKLISAITKVMK